MAEGLKILVIDDEEAIRFLIRRYLESSGFVVAEASNGKEALSMIDKTYAAQLVDINMPVMDGIQYLEELKKMSLNIPTLIVTGHLDEVEYPVLRKPFQKQTLIDALNSVLQ
ncbi:MAG: response regulator [Oligoflexia bacterium]|nr:response regulator [Oligoflexia bacterium]